MKDNFSELIQFSEYGGQVILEKVKGETDGNLNPENNVDTRTGADRTMFSYIPASGCPHAKQTAVFMVLRNDFTEESVQKLLDRYSLDKLAEEYHFILLFPNPDEGGWNYLMDEERDNDIDFLVRCFAALPKSKGKVAGFNGMIYYLGADPESSAMIMTMASQSPLNSAAVMIGRFPEEYAIPEGKNAPQAGWIYDGNAAAKSYFDRVNHNGFFGEDSVITGYTDDELSAAMIDSAWDRMFSVCRRWRNDSFGTYQPRIDFEKEGFIAHVNDDMLGVNNSFRHTWYEYIPPEIKESSDKVPLVIYFHGINCTALYGAEQSGWAELAKKEGFIVVFPNPAIEERWNVWDDGRMPSDMSFIMALIDHMKSVHPIDEERMYISGFSMGSMFTNAMAAAYPEVFAGALACNGPHWGYLKTLDQLRSNMLRFNRRSMIQNLPVREEQYSHVHLIADQKKEEYDYRMPFVQCAGLTDGAGFFRKGSFPLTNSEDNDWIGTIDYWKEYNRIPLTDMFSKQYESGICGDMNEAFEERFIDQYWYDNDHNDYYHFITVKRMPHAVDLREIVYGWNLIRQYRRKNDGSLVRITERKNEINHSEITEQLRRGEII